MGAKDYERAVYAATDLPNPEDAEEGLYHYIGDWDIHETDAAVDAVVKRRLNRIRQVKAIAEPLDIPAATAAITRSDFLSYSEYLDTVRRMGEIRTALSRIDNQARRQVHDDRHYGDKPHFYAAISPPNPNQTILARSFDVDRHTADRAGYLVAREKPFQAARWT